MKADGVLDAGSVRDVLLKLTTNAVHVTGEPHRDRRCGEPTQFDECCPRRDCSLTRQPHPAVGRPGRPHTGGYQRALLEEHASCCGDRRRLTDAQQAASPLRSLRKSRRSRPPPSALITDRGDQVAAGLVAATADLGADAAVLVVGRVLLALVGAGAAGYRARFDRRAEDAEIGLGLPAEDSAGGTAGIGAVEAEANAADQLLYVRLAEVGVGAACARSRAVDALVDTAQKQVAVGGDGARVRLEHFVNRHVTLLSARAGSVRFCTQHVDTREAAQRWAGIWERGWREHDEHVISALYADGSFWQQHPFREPEPGYLSRVFEEEESGEWDLLSIVIYFAVAVALAP